MPNEISIYEPRKMAEVVRRNAPVTTFLLSTFFNRIETFNTTKVDVDFKKGNRKLAPFVHRTIGGKIVPNTGYTTETYTPPLLAPEKLTTIDDIIVRSAGEDIYTETTPETRAVKKMAEDFVELDEMITRREEWMAVRAIYDGMIPIKGDGVDEVIDFQFTNKETLTSTKWSDTVNSDPLADISRWSNKVLQTGFVNPNICVMGSKAAEYFLANEKVQKILDIRHMDMAVIAPKDLPNGAKYLGYVAKDNISLYMYNSYYLDDFTDPANPVQKSLVPENQVALLSTNANYKRLYGAITILDTDTDSFRTVEATRVPDTYTARRPARRFLQLNSAPLPVPVETDSWFVGTVCDE